MNSSIESQAPSRPRMDEPKPTALLDFWRVCERHYDELMDEVSATTRVHPEYKAWSEVSFAAESANWRELLRNAMAEEWGPFDEQMRAQGTQFATLGLSFKGCFEITSSFSRHLLPRIIEAYGADPQRLLAVLRVAETLSERILLGMSQAYLDAQQRLTHDRERALGLSEERYRQLFDSSPLPMWLYDSQTLGFLAVNDAAVRQYGYSRSEFARMTLKDIRPTEDVPHLLQHVSALPVVSEAGDWRHRRKDGAILTVEISAHAMSFEGRPARLVLAHDVTERKQLEEQLRQAQKMDAVGQLAGGIAHDFNNLLTAILSFSEFVANDLGSAHASYADVQEVIQAARRAGTLTRQLLAFSRRQVLKPEILNINDILANTDKMLKRVIGEHIDLVTMPADELWEVRVDRGHLEQIILNLMVNARDAMPEGGKLTVETANVELEGAEQRCYVMLAVTDTGEGMDAPTQARIFEPFFTTKEPGRRLGLGLSTVFGMVKQAGGDVRVYSERGRGSTFKILLPRVKGEDDASSAAPSLSPAAHGGNETVLLVEDDEKVRAVAVRTLRLMGHPVLDVAEPKEAVRLIESHPGPIHLLITDMVMPQMNGQELAERLRKLRGESRVLFMSGYSGGALIHQGVLPPGGAYLEKPFTPGLFAERVRLVLDSPPSPPAALGEPVG